MRRLTDAVLAGTGAAGVPCMGDREPLKLPENGESIKPLLARFALGAVRAVGDMFGILLFGLWRVALFALALGLVLGVFYVGGELTDLFANSAIDAIFTVRVLLVIIIALLVMILLGVLFLILLAFVKG